jgi:hypothetical protein
MLQGSGKSAVLRRAPWIIDTMRNINSLGGFTFLTLLTILLVLAFAFHN